MSLSSTETPSEKCQHCGRIIQQERLTLRRMIGEASSNILNLERGLLFTARDLALHPERVVGAYVSGERGRYTNPFRYLLVTTTLLLLLSALTGFTDVIISEAGGNEVAQRVISYQNVFVFLSVPLAALCSLAFFWRADFNYAEHLVLNGYAYGQVNLLALAMIPFEAAFPKYYWELTTASTVLYLYVAWCYVRFLRPRRRALGIVKAVMASSMGIIFLILFAAIGTVVFTYLSRGS